METGMAYRAVQNWLEQRGTNSIYPPNTLWALHPISMSLCLCILYLEIINPCLLRRIQSLLDERIDHHYSLQSCECLHSCELANSTMVYLMEMAWYIKGISEDCPQQSRELIYYNYDKHTNDPMEQSKYPSHSLSYNTANPVSLTDDSWLVVSRIEMD